MMVKEELGEEWLSNHWFRFGASSLANDILMQLQKEADGHYRSTDDLSNDQEVSGCRFPDLPINPPMNDQQALFVRMTLDAWTERVNATGALLDKLSDEEMMQEVAPARNRGIYLMGHLIVVHDMMLPLLRFQEPLHPELKLAFLEEADNAASTMPSVQQLREHWKSVHRTLIGHMQQLPDNEWFTRHGSISEEDFANEPHRNRLNLVLNRTGHLSYHRGQLALLPNR
ncbi:MAG: DinB family protein [Flavobacteriales bacterium]|nr:DinB family protein [Flavobacteriales bacterium]